jgi:hypothetical protein
MVNPSATRGKRATQGRIAPAFFFHMNSFSFSKPL